MIVCSIAEAKSRFSALLEEVQKGSEVTLVEAGKPVAMMVPYRGNAKPRIPGSMSGKIVIHRDFDELPPDMAVDFGMIPDRE